MTTGDVGEVTVDGKVVEVVTSFIFLGALITSYGLCDKETRRGIAMGKAAMGGFTTTWKDIYLSQVVYTGGSLTQCQITVEYVFLDATSNVLVTQSKDKHKELWSNDACSFV